MMLLTWLVLFSNLWIVPGLLDLCSANRFAKRFVIFGMKSTVRKNLSCNSHVCELHERFTVCHCKCL